MSSETTSPLTFDLQQDLLDKLKQIQDTAGARSLSEVIRYAVSVMDVSALDLDQSTHRQISVRLSSDLRKRLVNVSKRKKISIGELLRVALDALPLDLPSFDPNQMIPKKGSTPKTKPKKSVAKKVAAKKAVKKVAAKKAVKKVAAKKAVKKVAAKKAVKKVAAKKAVKKVAAKKAVKKVAAKKAVKKVDAKKAAKKADSKKKLKKKRKKNK
jgi:hypothetical protein